MTSIWNDFGFRESPYATDPVPPTDEGDRLLVGRENELRTLLMYLTSAATHPTLEGENGVGKTSLVAVAGYRAKKAFIEQQTNQLLLPLERVFQLTPGETAAEFRRAVFLEVAHAFITNHDLLKMAGLDVPETGDVDRWLNAPIFSSRSLSVNAGAGAGIAGGSAPNTSAGFNEAGFEAAVVHWLRTCFRSRQAGGFVCVIDNLELLETSRTARALLESLRDSILNQPGLRWVLCGARGIVRTGASSPRLEGVLSAPMELSPLADEYVSDVVARRIEVFRMVEDAYAPVEPNGFRHIYDVLNSNLRNALKFCEDFSFWLREQPTQPESSSDRKELLEVWLAEMSERYLAETKGVANRAWQVFDHLVAEFGGSCSPSDFERFGFNEMATFRRPVRELEVANLVQSSVDDTDRRRKTIVVTPRGWLVNYKRSGFEITGRQ